MLRQKNVVVVITIIAAITIASVIYFYNTQSIDEERDSSGNFKIKWISSGPFAINKPKYKLGENIFMVVEGLRPNEAGNIIFVLPDGRTYTTIPFNGTVKSDFNQYFTPNTSVVKKIFKPEDLVGTWKVVFQGVSYKPLSFEIVNEFILGGDAKVKPILIVNSTN